MQQFSSSGVKVTVKHFWLKAQKAVQIELVEDDTLKQAQRKGRCSNYHDAESV